MGVISKIKKAYTNIDKKIGGALHGGYVKPKEEPSIPKTPPVTPPKVIPSGGGMSTKEGYITETGEKLPVNEESRKKIISGGSSNRNDNPLNLPLPEPTPIDVIINKPKPTDIIQDKVNIDVKTIEPTKKSGVIVTDYEPKEDKKYIKQVYYTSNKDFKPRNENALVIYTDKSGKLTGETSNSYYDITAYAGERVDQQKLTKAIKESPMITFSVPDAKYTILPIEEKEGKKKENIFGGLKVQTNTGIQTRGTIITGDRKELVSPTVSNGFFADTAEVLPNISYFVSRKVFPKKEVTTIVDTETRYFRSGTGQYNPINKEFSTPITKLPEQFSQQVRYESFGSTIPTFVKGSTYLGQYAIPIFGEGLLYGQTAEGGFKLYEGIKNKETPKIVQGILETAPGALFIGGKGLFKATELVAKSRLPKVEVLQPKKVTEPTFYERQWINPTTKKIESVYVKGYAEIPEYIRITYPGKFNIIKTNLDKPIVIERFAGKPKKIIEYTPKPSELGQPVVTATVKDGRKYIEFTLLSGDETQIKAVKLGRSYFGKPNKQFLYKYGKRESTSAMITAYSQPNIIGNVERSFVSSSSQPIKIQAFRKLTPKQQASYEFDVMLKDITGREFDASKYFKQYRPKKVDTTKGVIERTLPIEDDGVSIIKLGENKKSSSDYFQKLYSEQKADQLPKILTAPKPSPTKKPEQIQKGLFPEEFLKAEQADKAYSQYKYGYGYGVAGGTYSGTQDLIGINSKDLSLSISNQKPKIDTKPSVKTFESIKDTQGIKIDASFTDIIKDNIGFREGNRERDIQSPVEKIDYSLSFKEEQAVKQLQQQKTNLFERLSNTIKSKFFYKSPKSDPKINLKLKPKSSRELSSDEKKAFDVFVYKKGKELLIAKGLPEGLAKKLGSKEVLSTLRASFKLKERGTTTAEDIEFNLPTVFALSKRDKSRFIQRKNTRFGARSETKEAQFFRKQKTGKMKWF